MKPITNPCDGRVILLQFVGAWLADWDYDFATPVEALANAMRNLPTYDEKERLRVIVELRSVANCECPYWKEVDREVNAANVDSQEDLANIVKAAFELSGIKLEE